MNLAYTWNGDYLFPDLTIENSSVSYGKYGMLRRTFLKEHKRGWYQSLLLTGRLDYHLQQIDDASNARLSEIVSQMAKAGGYYRGVESLRSHGLEQQDEQHPKQRGGNHS